MNPNANDWINEFLARAHVPDDSDFRRLRRRAFHYRNIFFENYKTIRNKLHAHKEISEPNRIDSLYGKTKIRDLENTVVYLNKLYQCLYDLFENGRKPYLPNMPYSIRSIKGESLPPFQSPLIHQQVVTETKRVLEKLAHYDALKFK